MNIVNRYNCKHKRIRSIPLEKDGIEYRELICVDCNKPMEVISQKEYDEIFEHNI